MFESLLLEPNDVITGNMDNHFMGFGIRGDVLDWG